MDQTDGCEATKLVQRQLKKSQIENLGFNRAIRKGAKYWIAPIVVVFLGGIPLSAVSPGLGVASFVGAFVILVVWQWKCWRKGKALWDKVKDVTEPVDLDVYLKEK